MDYHFTDYQQAVTLLPGFTPDGPDGEPYRAAAALLGFLRQASADLGRFRKRYFDGTNRAAVNVGLNAVGTILAAHWPQGAERDGSDGLTERLIGTLAAAAATIVSVLYP